MKPFTITVDDDIELALPHTDFAQSLFELRERDYDYLAQWLVWPPKISTPSDFNGFIRDALEHYAKGTGMTCIILYRGQVVGVSGFNQIDHELSRVLIGYWVGSQFQGKGIVTRVCRFLVDYAFSHLEVDKVQIEAATDNTASRAVCERLDMTLEGVIRNAERIGERILDHAVYALYRR